jgi:hypothetical protein
LLVVVKRLQLLSFVVVCDRLVRVGGRLKLSRLRGSGLWRRRQLRR